MVPNLLTIKLGPLCLFVGLICAANLAPCARPLVAADKHPIQLVFDTDIGNDIDDALALGVIHGLVSRGECDLIAVTITNDDPLSAPFVDAVNTFYGRVDIPIGVVHKGPTSEASRYTGIANVRDGSHLRYPHKLLSGVNALEAVSLLRRTLAVAKDQSVVFVQVGYSTNLARLLQSAPDETCNLTGLELVKKKVRLLSIMAGSFAATSDPPRPEYNVKMDITSAKAVVSGWPTPIVFSGVEVGMAITIPAESIERDFAYVAHHPLAEAYRLHTDPLQDRPAWDLTSVLFAVRSDYQYFELSPSGRVVVANDGTTSFKPERTGPHRFLMLKHGQQSRVREALTQLTSQPPPLANCRP